MNRWTFENIRSIGLCFILLATLLPCSSESAQRFPSRNPQLTRPAPQPDSSPAVQNIRVEDGKVKAEIINSPLQSVLRELAERTGVIFEVRSQDNPRISVHLYGVSLQEAIQRIASDEDTMFFYDSNEPRSEHITIVRIFPRTNPVQQPGLIYLGTGTVTRSNVDIDTPEQAVKVLADATNLEDRKKAIDLLVRARSDAAINALMNSLSDQAPEIRVAAIEGLTSVGAHKALTEVIKKLKDADPAVRQSAATAVALLGDARNLKDLRPLRADKDANVAAAAELAIRRLSTSEKP
jgi:hypothetical protein